MTAHQSPSQDLISTATPGSASATPVAEPLGSRRMVRTPPVMSAVRRGEEGEEGVPDAEDVGSDAIELGEQRYVEMSEAEQFVLTVSENGMGKRTSSYNYRTTGRGGKGIVAMSITAKTGRLVASFPVEGSDQIMLVTNKGQLIRTGVEGIRIAGRSTQGVIVFDTAEDERVVSVERLSEEGEE